MMAGSIVVQNPKKPKQGMIVQYVLQRIRKNRNWVCLITGSTGSGKSWSALTLGCQLDPNFTIENCVFSQVAFMELINSGKLKKGSVIIFDEAQISLSSREWQSLGNRMLNYCLQTFRHKNIILLMTAPHFSFLDAMTRRLFHSYMETVSTDYEKKTNTLKPFVIQTSQRSGDLYYKYLRVVTPSGTQPIVSLTLPAPDKELIIQYEAKKTQFTNELNQSILKELKSVDKTETPKELTTIQSTVYHLVKDGMTDQEIADKIGKTRTYINQMRHTIARKGWQTTT